MNNPNISIIIPIYNVEKYLSECLDSVIRQTFKNFEIVCVDDASTDGSANILQEYFLKDNRIKIITQENNRGAGEARNAGIEKAEGEFLFFLDPDDLVCENILMTMYAAINESQADIVVSKSEVFLDKIFDDSMQYQGLLDRMGRYLNSFSEGVTKVQPDKIYYRKEPGVVWGRLYRKNFIENNKLRFVSRKIAHEDEGFWLKCLLHSPILHCINDVGVKYRIRDNSTMFQSSFKINEEDMIVSYIDAIKHIRKFSEKYFDDIVLAVNFILSRKQIPINLKKGGILCFDDGEKQKYSFLAKFCFWGKRDAYVKKLHRLERNIDAAKKIFGNRCSMQI